MLCFESKAVQYVHVIYAKNDISFSIFSEREGKHGRDGSLVFEAFCNFIIRTGPS